MFLERVSKVKHDSNLFVIEDWGLASLTLFNYLLIPVILFY